LRQGPQDDDAIDAQADCFVLALGDDADARHRDATVADELSLYDIDGDRDADARRCADQPTGAVEQRAAGIVDLVRDLLEPLGDSAQCVGQKLMFLRRQIGAALNHIRDSASPWRASFSRWSRGTARLPAARPLGETMTQGHSAGISPWCAARW
jgi:hypothetical protein